MIYCNELERHIETLKQLNVILYKLGLNIEMTLQSTLQSTWKVTVTARRFSNISVNSCQFVFWCTVNYNKRFYWWCT